MSSGIYYNQYDPSKKYYMVKALSGRAPQSQETNEIQSMLLDYLGRLGNSLYRNGTILSGCSPLYQNGKVTVTAGRVFANGLVLPVEEQELTVPGVGTTVISLQVTYTTVTSADDPDLLDPAIGRANYGKPGADRERVEARWTTQAPEGSIPMFTYTDGVLMSTGSREEIDFITEQIARRTYDESGNYLVDGMRVSVSEHPTDASKLIPSITGGKAVIRGKDVILPTSVDLPAIDKGLQTRNDVSVFSYSVNVFDVGGGRVIAGTPTVQGTWKETLTVTSAGGSSNDLRALLGGVGTVREIIKVTDASGVRNSADYSLSNNIITWTTNPPIGDYTVEVWYQYTIPGVTVENNQIHLPEDREYKHGSDVTVTYSFCLSRVDLVQLLPDGTISIKNGESDVLAYAPQPDSEALPLAEIRIPAGEEVAFEGSVSTTNVPIVEVVNYGLYRVTMREIRDLIKRVERQEFDTAATDLNNEAIRRGGTALKGAFSDGFISAKKLNQYSNVKVDVSKGNLELPEAVSTRVLFPRSSTAVQKRSLATIPYTEVGRAVVSTGTKDLALNQYNIFQDVPKLEAYGNEELFQELDYTTEGFPYAGITNAKYVRGVWGETPEAAVQNGAAVKIAQSEIVPYAFSTSRTCTVKGSNFGASRDNLVARVGGKLARMVPVLDASMTNLAGHIVVRDGTFEVKKQPDYDVLSAGNDIIFKLGSETVTYRVDTNNLSTIATGLAAAINASAGMGNYLASPAVANGNSFKVVLKPEYPLLESKLEYAAGAQAEGVVTVLVIPTNTGSIKSLQDGSFEAICEVPSMIPQGERLIVITQEGAGANEALTARARYMVHGATKERFTDLPLQGYGNLTAALAQTLTSNGRPLAGVGLFFTEGDATKPIEVQIRDVQDGKPGQTIYARKTLKLSDVQLPTVPASKIQSSRETRVTFDDPVFIPEGTEVAIVLDTGSLAWKVVVSELGQKDLSVEDGQTVTQNIEGSLFVGASTWSETPGMDLRYTLYEAVPTNPEGTSAILEFENVPALDATGIILRVAQGVPAGARISWQFRSGSESWKPLLPGIHTETAMQAAASFDLKAEISGRDKKMPWINFKALQLVTLKRASSGKYRSLEVAYSQNFTQAAVWLQTNAKENELTVTAYAGTRGAEPGQELEAKTMVLDAASEVPVEGMPGYFDRKYILPSAFSENRNRFMIDLDLLTSNTTRTPVVRRVVTSVN